LTATCCENIRGNTMNGYIGFYRGKRAEVDAETKFQAQELLAKKLGARHGHQIACELAEKNGEQVVHAPAF
jgi:hypothetical protein